MTITTPTGFLVALQSPPDALPKNPCYQGVARVPAYPSDEPTELTAMDAYVFGDFKSLETGLIPTYDRAVELWRLFANSPRELRILLWSADSLDPIVSTTETLAAKVTPLGFDVATLTGYWSIAQDISTSPWAKRFRAQLNSNGLFPDGISASQYLDQYKAEKEFDWDFDFQIGFVSDVQAIGN